MQLSKLYSNSETFKNIRFNLNGLNIIYAEVKSEIREKKNSHDLGKTKLAEIIDFMLLKGIDKSHFLLKIKNDEKSIFYDHIFYLEILLNTGKYLTIKRTVKANTKVSFSHNETSSNNFIPPEKWDYEDIPFAKSKLLLAEYLAMDFYQDKDYDYRKSINYSLRTQDDFKDVYKLNKFSAGRDVDWKPFMFDLLGFDGRLLSAKYSNDELIEKKKAGISYLKNEFSVRVEERDEIVAEKAIVENEFKEVEIQIDRFNFYQNDKDLIKNGIDEIEARISTLNSSSYALNYDIDKLRKSISNNFSFDLDKVRKVFEETKLFFPDQLVKDYKDLIDFNKKLTIERNKLLKETLLKKEEDLKTINNNLISLNNEREKLLSHLTDQDTFSKFKFCQKELVKVEGKLLKLQEKIDTIDKIISKENEIEALNDKIKETTEQIKKLYQSTDKNEKYTLIRSTFSQFYKRIMDENAVLSWSINQNNNVEFITPKVKSKSDNKKDTAKDEGNTYMKLLCVAFDLAIICSYNKESYYRFIYHDDVLSQQDNGIKLRLLELIKELLKVFNIQYIVSVIKADLPIDSSEKPILFDSKEIVLRLSDVNITGTLFGFEF